MHPQNDQLENINFAERVLRYRIVLSFEGIENRIAVAQRCEEYFADLLRRKDLMATGGALRTLGYAALDLAMTPSTDRLSAATKVTCLKRAMISLDGHAVDADLRRIRSMISAAIKTERRKRSLSLVTNTERKSVDNSVNLSIDLVHRHLFYRMSAPFSLASTLQEIDEIAGDYEVLPESSDELTGSIHSLRYSIMYCMAAPIMSISDLHKKYMIIVSYYNALIPIDLLRPLIEAALLADCRQISAPPDEVNMIKNILLADDDDIAPSS